MQQMLSHSITLPPPKSLNRLSALSASSPQPQLSFWRRNVLLDTTFHPSFGSCRHGKGSQTRQRSTACSTSLQPLFLIKWSCLFTLRRASWRGLSICGEMPTLLYCKVCSPGRRPCDGSWTPVSLSCSSTTSEFSQWSVRDALRRGS